MVRKGCGFPWGGKSTAGEGLRYARDAKCPRCKAYSAPSTPRGTRSRSRSPRGRSASKSRGGCFGGSTVSTRSKYRDTGRNINPRALPIVLHPDHKPRKVAPMHRCQSPRRGCTDHRCHKDQRGWCTIS
ncbi:hypothetical protein KC19_1G311400 [Ceratodon purpureus]|uniref:Uncharacterized protein n=1 Tax=Ceratodon purpureus TaxID=3225 RepID=A0A8T0JBC4_CERPU|nr:hypothetical protein KC19_1G311400 [Ceratodon purpureus]